MQFLLQVRLELFFQLILAQAAEGEHYCGMTFLPWCGFELLFQLATRNTVVNAALRTGHHSRV